jgi:hypothetical protein
MTANLPHRLPHRLPEAPSPDAHVGRAKFRVPYVNVVLGSGTKDLTMRKLVFAALAAGALLAVPSSAHAEEVAPTAKGIVGGAFLGGEVVVFGEALFGVRSTAAYLVGAGVGAAAGGVGGYFIEQAVDDGRIPAYMLAGGLALLIPAVVVTLDATRYLPSEGAREDKPVNLPPSDPGKPGGSSVGAEPAAPPPAAAPPAGGTTPPPSGTTPAPTAPPAGGGTQAPQAPQAARPATSPSSLINVRDGSFAMGIPVPEVRPVLGATERTRMGAQNNGSELRFPVVRVTF